MYKVSPGQLVTAESQDMIKDHWVVGTAFNLVFSLHLFVFEIFLFIFFFLRFFIVKRRNELGCTVGRKKRELPSKCTSILFEYFK